MRGATLVLGLVLAACGDGPSGPEPVPPRLGLTFTAELESWVEQQFGQGTCTTILTISAEGEEGAWAEWVAGNRTAEPDIPGGGFENLPGFRWAGFWDQPSITAGETLSTKVWWLGSPPGHEWIFTLQVRHHDGETEELVSSFVCE